jgi:coenzyme F420-reducing hydrogenase alpha subunit
MDILIAVLSVICLSFFISYIRIAIQLKKVTETFLETVVMYMAIQEENGKPGGADKSTEDIHKESFIKFLSDSRDWAYQYIEDVQKGLNKFINEIGPSINYFDSFGMIADASPHHSAMKKISKEFKELKKLLPEDSDDRR